MPITLELMPLEEKLPESPPPKTMVVRYGYLREIGEFVSDLTQKVGCGSKVVVRTDRGTEIAEMLTTVCGNGGCNKSITREKLLDYIKNSGGRNYPFSEEGRVLRVATTQDLAEQSKLDEHRGRHMQLARELVQKHSLPMKIVEVEHVLGGERILFYFTAEQRVDFRGLVRDLAHELHTRIELRQVGARDEARLTADYEKCGQHCCCRQFLKVLTPISMRSAKVQKATLDPTKISGRCGRLMCCLRYEDQTYEELRKKLPKRNTRVRTEKGDGWVVDGQILTQLVLVQYDDLKREAVPMEQILEFDRPRPVLPDGRVMQSPNDRPPQFMEEGRGVRMVRGNGGGPPGAPSTGQRARPQPGAPAEAPPGDPLAVNGPTGGDLSAGDAIDDLIADAMDDVPPPAAGDAGRSAPAMPPPRAPVPQNVPPRMPRPPGGQRPPQGQRPQQQRAPQQRGPFGGPPRGGQGGPGRGPVGPGPRPQQPPRGPQPFRPPPDPRQGPPGGAPRSGPTTPTPPPPTPPAAAPEPPAAPPPPPNSTAPPA